MRAGAEDRRIVNRLISASTCVTTSQSTPCALANWYATREVDCLSYTNTKQQGSIDLWCTMPRVLILEGPYSPCGARCTFQFNRELRVRCSPFTPTNTRFSTQHITTFGLAKIDPKAGPKSQDRRDTGLSKLVMVLGFVPHQRLSV